FSADRVGAMTELDVSGYGITDLTGIEHFRSLVSLDASNNLLENVEGVETLGKLEKVDLSFNLLEQVEFSAPALHTVNLEGNRLAALDFAAGLPALMDLNARDNGISELEPLQEANELLILNL